jgi:serine/threonine protein kinase
MSPVAEYNLLEFYTAVTQYPTNKLTLRRFFGCLVDGLAYLHSEKVRRRDIKPQIILVKANRVYLTDFGVSLDWANLSGSTTEDNQPKLGFTVLPRSQLMSQEMHRLIYGHSDACSLR